MATPELAERLQVPARTRLTWAQRECLGPDGWPAMLENTYRRGATVLPHDDVSVQMLVGEFSDDESRALGLHRGVTALRVQRTRYGGDGRPVETADLILRADRWGIRL
jgi:GntR family transcriptional regulator